MISTIKNMIAWSSKKGEPCGRGIVRGTFCRNWRTWLGHSTVADNVTALGSIPLLFTDYWFFVVLGLVLWAGVNVFYFEREFGRPGRKGNFFDENDAPDRNDKQTDSVLDFLVPLSTSTFLKFNFGPAIVVSVAAIQFAATYFIYGFDTKNRQ